MASDTKSKADLIAERQANLPLPEDPPVKSDFNTADPSGVNVGSGRFSSDISAGGDGADALRGPATGGSAARESGQGEVGNENVAGLNVGRVLGGVPSDATSSGKGTVETKHADYGYPQKNDPSTGT